MFIRTKSKALSIVILIAAALVFAVAGTAAAESAKAVAEHMDKGKHTSSDIKAYLKGLKGKTVTAEGRVNDVLSGKTGNKVVLFVDTPKSKDFVVDVYVDDASKLHKGDQVSCKGEYARYNMFTLNGITLKDGSCKK
ncbi:MAG: hypothetical protein A2010_06355 [Nitrospirae bacterium GWD2_57_9]|nr:MAG: hypothetical protein A2010_06355 [Nitrospirae bacterium GWD2_57_9]OGW49288.1 MAG: hypothetical protein A2078_04525 [Nitrospirae bacterium GWC2_57_9]